MSRYRSPNHYYQSIERQIKSEIESESDNYLLSVSTKELVDYYLRKYALSPFRIEVVEGGIEKDWRLKKIADLRTTQMSRAGYECEWLKVFFRFAANPHLDLLRHFWECKVENSSTIRWMQAYVEIAIENKGEGHPKDPQLVANEFESAKSAVYEWLEQINTQISNWNNTLQRDFTSLVNNRKAKLEEDLERYASLLYRIKVPLKRKVRAEVERIQLDTRPLVNRIKPAAGKLEDYRIDSEKVLDVIKVVDNHCRQLEKTPKTFEKSREEDLRNILLVGLNGIFEGKATGETFMAAGKTDIYLNINAGNILVFECKMWGGKQLHTETIDQILNYLTWRVNYGVIISFSRRRSMSRVLNEGKAAISNHPMWKGSLEVVSDAHYLSQHRLPSDGTKCVELHHLFYQL